MPVGIENLATGFLQGLTARKQQDRQDMLDARETERFDMQKQQFADQQKANALNLQLNQANLDNNKLLAERATAQWNKDQEKSKKEEAFLKDMQTIWGFEKSKNHEGLANFITEKNKAAGVDGAFDRDPKSGALILNNGVASFTGKDGVKRLVGLDGYAEDFYNTHNPLEAIKRQILAADEIEKEKRQHNNAVALARVQKELTPKSLSFIETGTGTYGIDPMTGKTIEVKTPNGEAIIDSEQPEKEMSPVALSLFDKKEIITEKYGGGTKQVTTRDEQGLQDFMTWAETNNKPLTVRSVGLWKNAKTKQPTSNTTQPTVSNTRKLVDWVKSKNVKTQEQLNAVIKELSNPKLNWTKAQINAALDEAGL